MSYTALLVLLCLCLVYGVPLAADNSTSTGGAPAARNFGSQQQGSGPRVFVGTLPGGSIQGANKTSNQAESKGFSSGHLDDNQGIRREVPTFFGANNQAFQAANQGFQANNQGFQPNSFTGDFRNPNPSFDVNRGFVSANPFAQGSSQGFAQQLPMQQSAGPSFVPSGFQNPQQGAFAFGQQNVVPNVGTFGMQGAGMFGVNQQQSGQLQFQQQDGVKKTPTLQQDNKPQQQQQQTSFTAGSNQQAPIKRETSSINFASKDNSTDSKRNTGTNVDQADNSLFGAFGGFNDSPFIGGPNGPNVPPFPPHPPAMQPMMGHPFGGGMPMFHLDGFPFPQDFGHRGGNFMFLPVLFNPGALMPQQQRFPLDFNHGFGQADFFPGGPIMPHQPLNQHGFLGQQQGLPPTQGPRSLDPTTVKN